MEDDMELASERDNELRQRLESLWQDLAEAGYAVNDGSVLDILSIVIESLDEYFDSLELREVDLTEAM